MATDIVKAAEQFVAAEAHLRRAVASARSASDPLSWKEIGMALGVSAQAAHERFSKGRPGSEVKEIVAKVPRSPKGAGNIDQSVFKAVLAIRLEKGEPKNEAVEHAIATVRAESPSFVPRLPAGFFD